MTLIEMESMSDDAFGKRVVLSANKALLKCPKGHATIAFVGRMTYSKMKKAGLIMMASSGDRPALYWFDHQGFVHQIPLNYGATAPGKIEYVFKERIIQ